MLSVRLDKEIEHRLTVLANKTGRTRTFIAQQAIEAQLGELEARYCVDDEPETAGVSGN